MIFWMWIIVLVASVVLEIATTTALISIWFAVGAIVALMLNQLHVAFIIQVIVFFLVSIVFIITCRPLATNYLRGNTVATNADRAIGVQTVLLKPIHSDAWGEVKINGAVWNATSFDNKPIEEGKRVEVLAIEGSKLIVKEI